MLLGSRSWPAIVAFAFACAACSDSALATADAGTNAAGTTTIRWAGNDNGASVLDANGNAFHFTDGCLYSSQSGAGPVHFCLTPTASNASGYASYGATNCSNPSSNSDCNAASFSVALTADPANSAGCIAVLTNGSATSLAGEPLAVTEMTMSATVTGSTSSVTGSESTFDIQADVSPTAYKVYWNGIVPICGGDAPYAGTYVGSLTSTGSTVTYPVSLTVDSGDLVNDNTTQTTGSLTAAGSGSFSGHYTCSAGCVGAYSSGGAIRFAVTVTAASKNAAGKEVLSGTATADIGTGWTFSATQQ